jgi:hypothetical protein
VPSQVAVPFADPGQGVHAAIPQVAVLVFDTQRPPQMW